MSELQHNGLKLTTDQLQEGDVALVIRKDGSVEAILDPSQAGENFDMGNIPESILDIFGLMLISAQEELLSAAKENALEMMAEAMKLRVVN